MKKIISTLTLLFGLAGTVLQAGPVEKIILKNGTVMEGYISKQRPGKDIVFTSSKAVVYLPSKNVKSIANHSVEWQMLPPAWQQWAEENDAVQGSGKNKTVLLSDITKLSALQLADSSLAKPEPASTTYIPKVRILEEGAILKYLDLAPVAYTLSWDTVQFIRRDKRAATDLTGLNDIVELKNSGKTVEGQIIEQVPGKLLRLLKSNGIVEVINQEQIIRQKKVKVNPNQDLFEQSPLLDIVQTKGNSFRGIIVEQYFGDAKNASYLLVQTPEGSLERVEHADITETRREENPRYKLLTDVILNKGVWLVNRQSVKNAVTEERDDLVILSAQSDSLVLRLDSIDNRLVVEANFENEYEADDIALLKIGPKLISKKEYGNAFTFREIVTNSIRYTAKETSLNHTTKLVYPVSSRGYYVLYEPRHKRTVLCVIE